MQQIGTFTVSEAQKQFDMGELEGSDMEHVESVLVYRGDDGNTGWIQKMHSGKYYTFACTSEYYGRSKKTVENLLKSEHFDENS